MKENLTKDQYALPECRVIEVRLTKVIATSGSLSDFSETDLNGTGWE